MTTENTQQPADKIEDLTVIETETANVKGGAAVDYLLQIDGIQGESTEDRHTR
ncbi:MAG TPA: hypothetical protein VLE19_01430 [Pyrinomonadaceae bacterium]|nr:hypothetical protein [Pyrinomonadaceae bacterium]